MSARPVRRRGITVWVDPLTGEAVFHPEVTDGMTSPVRCMCGQVYDLGTVTVTARYADCSVWTTPCCRRSVDDRPAWGSTEPSAYTRISRPRPV